jgi:hypothetical protein
MELMTDAQKRLARHALGFPNKQNTSYRNRYCIHPGSAGYVEWESMVAQGDALKRTGLLWDGADMFHLTLKGALAAREENENISRENTLLILKLEAV